MYRAALLIAVLTLAAACGSDGDNAAGTTTTAPPTVSADDAKSALESELSQGGGGGIVQLETDTPKQITCEKDSGAKSGWRCTVTPSKSGESYLCIVEVDPQTKRATKSTCGPINN